MTRDEFNDKSQKAIAQAISFAEKARREGLLALENKLEDIEQDEERGILKCGLRLVIDGTDRIYIDKILSNLIELEKDEYARKLKTIKKEAVLLINDGVNTRVLAMILLSYLDDDIVADIEKAILGDNSSSKNEADDLDLDA